MDKLNITSIKAIQSDLKKGWFLIHQYSKDPITGEEIDLGVACGWPIKKGYVLSRETFVVVQKEYSLDEKIISQLKHISDHIRSLKEKEQQINNLYIAEISKGIVNADISLLSDLQSNYKLIVEEIETAAFFSDNLIKILDSDNTKKIK